MRKRILAITAAVLLATAGAVSLKVFAKRGPTPSELADTQLQAIFGEPRPVSIETVRFAGQASDVSYPGTVKASEKTELAFRVGGPLIEVAIKAGDVVHRGDVLMRIDPRDFENRASAAQAELEAAKAKYAAMRKGAREEDVSALEAQLRGAQATLENATLDFERAQTLFEQKVIPQADFDRATSTLEVAQARVADLSQQLKKAHVGDRPEDIAAMEANIQGLETALKIARDALADTVLRAPYDGVIICQRVENFEMVQPGQAVLALHDISTLEIDVDVPEQELIRNKLDPAGQATVAFAALPDRTFDVRLKEWNTDADPLTRTYTLTFAMKAPADVRILPGMTAEVSRSLADQTDNGKPLIIPSSAVVADTKGQSIVWVFDQATKTAQPRPITPGPACDQNHVIVRNGLKAGETIVTAGAEFITADMKLTPLPSNESLEPQKNL